MKAGDNSYLKVFVITVREQAILKEDWTTLSSRLTEMA